MTENISENPNNKYWTGEAPKIDDNSVKNFANYIFFYKIPANPCVIKLGNLIKMTKKTDDGADFILEFGNNDKGTDGNSFASDIEFDSITLTLSQDSINARIRTQQLSSVLQESGEPVSEEDEKKKILEDEKAKLLNLTDADNNLSEDEKKNAKETITGLRSIEGLKNLSQSGIKMAEAALNDLTSFIPGGGKRSVMSSFSRQFELPMPCHAKKRRSRSKKSRGGRRKKGKHTRKHHK